MELIELIYSWGVSDSRSHLAGGKCIHSPYYLTMCARLMKETHAEVILSSIEMYMFYWKKSMIERDRDQEDKLYKGLLYFPFLFPSKPLQMVAVFVIWVSLAQ